jgi:hypothetical protein
LRYAGESRIPSFQTYINSLDSVFTSDDLLRTITLVPNKIFTAESERTLKKFYGIDLSGNFITLSNLYFLGAFTFRAEEKRGGEVMPQFSRYEYSSVSLDTHGLKNMKNVYWTCQPCTL